MRTVAIQALVAQACALDCQGKQALAQEKMELALSLAEDEGLIRTFVDEGEAARAQLTRCRRSLVESSPARAHPDIRRLSYVDRLLSSFPLPPVVSDEQARPLLVEPLTARELEVLQLIAAGLSNRDIAERLVVTVGTVKAHTSSIYRKLDAPGRTRAVAVARENHLI